MRLVSTDNNAWWEEGSKNPYLLPSGITITDLGHLDCGGMLMYPDFINSIKQYGGKSVYNRGFEWCAGCGTIGFEILGQGISEHMVFSDYYDRAIHNCLETAEYNDISKKVTGYISATIAGIPSTEKWDLVVGNPPHTWDMDQTAADLKNSDVPVFMQDNIMRLIVDHNMETHKEFFANIRSRLSDDADIFISEVDTSRVIPDLAECNGLKLINTLEMPTTANQTNLVLHHYKPIS